MDAPETRHVIFDFPWAPVPEALICDASVPATAVRLWALLARHGLTPDSCYPSQEYLGERLDLAERTVRRLLGELEEAGWIRRFRRTTATGDRTSDGYELLAKYGQAKRPESSASPRANLSAKREPVERDQRELLRSSPAPDKSARPTFDDFWRVYPRKTGKGAARKAFEKAVKTTDARDVCNAAWRFAHDANLPEPQFVPHPATWLNQERWEDGPLPPRSNGRGPTPTERTMQNVAELLREGGEDGERGRGGASGGGAQRGLPA